MKSVVIGGTAGLGREIATVLAMKGHSLLITGRNKQDVEACAADLNIRYGADVYGLAVDASNHENFLGALMGAATSFGSINYLFLPIGASNQQDNGNLEIEELNKILSSNLISVVLAVKAFRSQFKITERAVIVGFSSIAAIRGRGENVIYSASKKGLESYFESIRIILLESNISVKYYRLGYLDTYQAYGKHLLFPKKDPNKVARNIVSNLNRTRLVSYYPRYWRAIAFIIRMVPTRVYKSMTS